MANQLGAVGAASDSFRRASSNWGDDCAAVAVERLGKDGVTTLTAEIAEIADDGTDGELLLVRPDAHLGWRGHADPACLDRWLTAMTPDAGVLLPRLSSVSATHPPAPPRSELTLRHAPRRR